MEKWIFGGFIVSSIIVLKLASKFGCQMNCEFVISTILSILGILISLYIAFKSKSLENKLTSYRKKKNFVKETEKLSHQINTYLDSRQKYITDNQKRIAELANNYFDYYKDYIKNDILCEAFEEVKKLHKNIVKMDYNRLQSILKKILMGLEKMKGEEFDE